MRETTSTKKTRNIADIIEEMELFDEEEMMLQGDFERSLPISSAYKGATLSEISEYLREEDRY